MCNRRCCCRDVYWDNDDSTTKQLHLPSSGLTPSVRYSLGVAAVGNHLGAVDYHNGRVVTVGNVGAVFKLFITPDNKLQAPRFVGNCQTFSPPNHSVAIDWAGSRIFYAADRDSTPSKYSFRVVNLDGTGDTEIATEDYTTSVRNFPSRTLQYDPIGAKLYYTRLRLTNIITGNSVIELRSMNPDGTNQQTEVVLASATAPDTIILRGNFVVPSQGITIPAVRFSSANTTSLFLVTISTAASFTVKSVVAPVTGSFPISNPQYCYKDNNVYFLNFDNSIDGTGDKRASYHRINLGGTPEEVVFSFVDQTGQDLYGWSGWTAGAMLRLACGMETFGSGYTGVG